MSRNDEKAGNVVDMDFSALDTELAELAQDTPEVPAGFHDSWTQAIREDAKNNPREAAPATADKAEYRKADARRQRRHILSAAAAFVVVISGVWLAKDRIDVLNRKETAPAPAVQEQAAVPPEAASAQEEDGVILLEDQEAGMYPVENAFEESEEEAEEVMLNYADAGGSASEAAYKASAPQAQETDAAGGAGSWDSAGEAGETGDLYLAAEAAGNSIRTEAAAENMAAEEEPLPEMVTEEMPEPTAIPATPEPTAEPATPEPAPVPEVPEAGAAVPAGEPAAAEAENITFLQRVWNFLLKITPWALGIVVVALFLITYVIRAIQRKRQKGK